jgi:hypothetical protein
MIVTWAVGKIEVGVEAAKIGSGPPPPELHAERKTNIRM